MDQISSFFTLPVSGFVECFFAFSFFYLKAFRRCVLFVQLFLVELKTYGSRDENLITILFASSYNPLRVCFH